MRTDEDGNQCPATLGEYRDLCASIGGDDCAAVRLLDNHIVRAARGRDAVVVQPDSQMRALLQPMLIHDEQKRARRIFERVRALAPSHVDAVIDFMDRKRDAATKDDVALARWMDEVEALITKLESEKSP